MGDRLYFAARRFGKPFAYRCVGRENILGSGPGIYASNHLGPIGPIQTVLSLPVRLHPWILAETIDPKRAAARIHQGLVRPVWALEGRLGRAVATLLSRPAVSFLNGLDCVPVERDGGPSMSSFRRSLALLSEGRSLLIFPEDEYGPLDPATQIRPFLGGFLLLCVLYEQLTGRRLPVYPVAVSNVRRTVSIGVPLFLDANGRRRDGIERTRVALQEAVCRLLHRAKHGGTEDAEEA